MGKGQDVELATTSPDNSKRAQKVRLKLNVDVEAPSCGGASPTTLQRMRQPTAFAATSLSLALERAHERLPKDSFGEPYKRCGLFEPYSTIRTLGTDAFFYIRCLQEGFLATLLAMFCSMPQMMFNMGMLHPPPDIEAEYRTFFDRGLITGLTKEDTWTANASWSETCPLGDGAPLFWGRPGGNAELLGAPYLSVVHVVSDSASLLVFVIFLIRLQRLSLKEDAVIEEIAETTSTPDSRRSRWVRYERAWKVLKSTKISIASTMSNIASSAKRISGLGTVASRINKIDPAFDAAATNASAAGQDTDRMCATSVASTSCNGDASADMSPDADASTEAKEYPLQELDDDSLIVSNASKRNRWHRFELRLPPVSQWWRSSAAAPVRTDMVARACSVVLWGWADGSPVPPEAITLLSEAVEPPVVIQQAQEVFELEQAQLQLEDARTRRDRRLGSSAQMDKAQELVDHLADRLSDLSSRRSSIEGERTSNGPMDRFSQWHTSGPGRLLPLCFVTFRSTKGVRIALGDEVVGALRQLGVRVGPAPRPTDIEWSHLHRRNNKRLLFLWDTVTIFAMVPLISMAIVVATGFAQMCLFWVPANCLFTNWCPAEKWLGGLSWLWGIIMFTSVYELLHQLTALPLGDGGLWPKNFAPSFTDWYHSRTMGQFRFVKVVAIVEMLAVFAIMGILVTAFNVYSTPISTHLCDISCVCWWINPHYAIGSWYDFGAGFGVNAIVNALIGDALLNSFVVRHLASIFKRRVMAHRQPTQHLMDESVRSRDKYYLPWRIVHLVKVWFFAVVLWGVVPLVALPALAYYAASIIIDRANLLALLEPIPPSSGICMRFVLSALMPAAVVFHCAVTFLGYLAKLQDPDTGSSKVSLERALEDPRFIFYVAFCFVLFAGMLYDMLVVQHRRAKRYGLLTPWEVCKAAVMDDTGFCISSRSEPFPVSDAHIESIPDEIIQKLYKPPFVDQGVDVRDGRNRGATRFFKQTSSEQADRKGASCRSDDSARAKDESRQDRSCAQCTQVRQYSDPPIGPFVSFAGWPVSQPPFVSYACE